MVIQIKIMITGHINDLDHDQITKKLVIWVKIRSRSFEPHPIWMYRNKCKYTTHSRVSRLVKLSSNAKENELRSLSKVFARRASCGGMNIYGGPPHRCPLYSFDYNTEPRAVFHSFYESSYAGRSKFDQGLHLAWVWTLDMPELDSWIWDLMPSVFRKTQVAGRHPSTPPTLYT